MLKKAKPVKLTPARKKKYLNRPQSCPFCGATDIEGGSIDVDGGYCSQRVHCVSCRRHWLDCYTLTDVVEL